MTQLLLIESDHVIAQSVMSFMSQQGVDVSITSSALEAIQICDSTLPDVIVVDSALTGHSGVEFLHEFRSYHDWSHVPILLWSMQRLSTRQVYALQQLGVNDVLYKPKTSLAILLSHVQSLTLLAHE